MKKKWLGVAAVAAVMTLSTGMTAFAAGWVKESTPYGDKWKYVYDDGSWKSGNWFTDPDTQLVYHLDPDGYAMTDTQVDGYWLDSNGVRQEKSEAQLEREAKETVKKEGKKNPGKKVASDKAAAKAAVENNAALGTTRTGYIAELKIIINKITKNLADTRTDESVQILSEENNVDAQRSFRDSNSVTFYQFTMWSSAKARDNSIDFMYMYDAAPEADRELYNTAYNQTMVAALGEAEGKAVTDYVQSQREQGITQLTREGKTDAGNSYTVKYNNNRIDVSVTCSEIVPEENTEENAEAAATTETAAAETQQTSGTIVAGAKAETTETEAAQESESAQETTEGTENTAQ